MLNRFEKTSYNIHAVQAEVYILENWLDVHPFPKYKHGAKYIKELLTFQ